MPRLGYEDIQVSDLVLVEANITRYVETGKSARNDGGGTQTPAPSPDKGSSRDYNALNWKTWTASLELRAVSLLSQGPRKGPADDGGQSFDLRL